MVKSCWVVKVANPLSNLEPHSASDSFSNSELNAPQNAAGNPVPLETASSKSVPDIELDTPELWCIPDFSGLAAAKIPGNSGHSLGNSGANAAIETEQLQQAEGQKGFEQGFAEGMQAAQKQSAERQRQFDDVLRIFEAPLKQLDQQVSADLLLLATRLAEALVRQQVTLDPRLMQPLIQDALSVLEGNHETASIYLNPQDHVDVSAYLAERQTDELERQFGSQYQGELRFEISADLNRGDIQVKTKNARVDASLEKRFEQIFAVLASRDSDLAISDSSTDSIADSSAELDPNFGSQSQLEEEEARH